jgi:4-amino-4-deoxy-L-arabinose transferase-like glycosyltransferase
MGSRSVRRLFLALGIYFLLQIVIRVAVSPALELDEAEQLILTQYLDLGYGAQPPLYSWLLSALFSLFGIGIFSLALMKNLLLYCTYALTYRAARSLGHGVEASVVATLSLLFIPQIAWESQRDLTHSVLATTLTAATILCWLRLKRDQSAAGYVLAGLCWGAGLLGKYNFGIFLVSLLAASWSIPEYRLLVLNSRMFYAIGTMLAVVTPHVVWALNHLPVLLSSSGKFKQATQGSYASALLSGTGSLLLATLAFVAPLLLISAAVCYLNRQQTGEGFRATLVRQLNSNLLLRCILFAQVICLLMVLLFRVTSFKDRWMQPILFFLPVALLPFLEPVLTDRCARQFRYLAGAVAGLVLAGLACRPLVASYTGEITRFNFPYPELAAQLGTEMESAELVLAQSTLLGGSLRLHYPRKQVAVPSVMWRYRDCHPQRLLVVWQDEASERRSDRLWDTVDALMGEQRLFKPNPTARAPFRHLPGKIMTLSSGVVERTGSPSSLP